MFGGMPACQQCKAIYDLSLTAPADKVTKTAEEELYFRNSKEDMQL